MKYFISKFNVEIGWSKFFQKGWGDQACYHDIARIKKKEKKGFLPFWDRSKNKFMWVKVIKQTSDRFGYIVEARKISSYWKDCFIPVDDESKHVVPG